MSNRSQRRHLQDETSSATLREATRSNRPERRTALVARELARYKVDIAALSETRLSNQGTSGGGETVKTGAAYFEANRITAVKAICETRKSQLPLPPPHNPIAQPPSTCSRCQRTFLATIGLVIHLRTNFSTRTAPTVVSPSTSPSSPMPSDNVDRPSQPPLPSSSSTVSTPAAVASAMPINTTHNPVTSTNVNTTAVNTGDEDPVYTCPHWDRTFTSRIGPVGHLRIRGTGIDRSSDIPSTSSSPITTISITEAETDIADFSCPHCPRTFTSRVGLVGHLQIHRTETSKPVPVVPTCTRLIRLHCPHCTRTFIHHMGLLRHRRVH
ncbi:hypothetical protein SprV_0100264100 [Sparganum proliferum]